MLPLRQQRSSCLNCSTGTWKDCCLSWNDTCTNGIAVCQPHCSITTCSITCCSKWIGGLHGLVHPSHTFERPLRSHSSRYPGRSCPFDPWFRTLVPFRAVAQGISNPPSNEDENGCFDSIPGEFQTPLLSTMGWRMLPLRSIGSGMDPKEHDPGQVSTRPGARITHPRF